MKLQKIIELLEWKEDLAKGEIILHYTDIDGLLGILESKRINKNFYTYSTSGQKETSKGDYVNQAGKKLDPIKFTDEHMKMDDKGRRKFHGEVATMRPSSSMFKTKLGTTRERQEEKEMEAADNMANLSDHYFIAEIQLNKEKIKAGVRGVKSNKIAEYPIHALHDLKYSFETLSKLAKGSIFEKTAEELSQKLKTMQDVNKLKNKWSDFRLSLIKNMKVFDAEKQKKINSKIVEIGASYKMYDTYAVKMREGEERISQDIPLESKYCQIRLLPGILSKRGKPEDNEKIRKLVESNKNLFKEDSIFARFMAGEKR
jgi:hypothetical protein